MEKRKPVRTCIGCGEKKNKDELIRIVRTPEGEVIKDPSGKMNQRGAYICPDSACLVKAAKRHALSRSFRTEIADDVYDRLSSVLGEEHE